ncbi:MAG: hypothetical protein ACAI43_18460 [Phycisphaerae bacterium]
MAPTSRRRRIRQWARTVARWALNAATVASAVLCLAVGVVWVRSYRATDDVVRQRTCTEGADLVQRFATVTTYEGTIGLDWSVSRVMAARLDPGDDRLVVGTLWMHSSAPASGPPPADDEWTHRWGPVGWRPGSSGSDGWPHWAGHAVHVTVRCWFPAVLFALMPAARSIAWARRRRRLALLALAGCCPACGYDLRATPGRCPECGWVRMSPLISQPSPPPSPHP